MVDLYLVQANNRYASLLSIQFAANRIVNILPSVVRPKKLNQKNEAIRLFMIIAGANVAQKLCVLMAGCKVWTT